MPFVNRHFAMHEVVDATSFEPLHDYLQHNGHRAFGRIMFEIAHPEESPKPHKCLIKPPFPKVVILEHMIHPERPGYSLVSWNPEATLVDAFIALNLIDKPLQLTFLFVGPLWPGWRGL